MKTTSFNVRVIQAFTLLELMVAVSVLSLFMLILFELFNETTRAWAAAERKMDAFREARAALYYMSRDLRNAYISTNTPMEIRGAGFVGTNICFIATSPAGAQESDSRSDLCTVGYSVAYTTDASGGSSSYKLYRYFLSSNPTFTNILAGPLSLFLSPPPNPSLNSANDEVMARNVFNLQIEAVDTNSSKLDFSTGAGLITNSSLQVIKITLNAYNRATAARLPNAGAWSQTNNPMQKANRQEFSTAIGFP